MAQFDDAIDVILQHEGWDTYTDDPVDPGGATKWGMSLRTLRAQGDLDGDGLLDWDLDGDGDVDEADVQRLTLTHAYQFYHDLFWKPGRYAELLFSPIATKVMDTAVNTGPRVAHKFLQRALQAMGYRLVDDGLIGRVTIGIVNQAAQDILLPAFRTGQLQFYHSLVSSRPSLRKYINGWRNRALS